jgi:selenocysteine lyase/cysteine desulfurase
VSGPVITVDFPGRDLKRLYDTLWDHYKLAVALTPGSDVSGIRFSPHIYNTDAEIDAVATALRETV